jgi:endonuclease YncB( thermonuclease family)
MPSGWEKAVDYGGRNPGRLHWVALAALFIGLAGLFLASNGRGAAAPAAKARAPTATISGRASVIDGDTIELRGQSIRLWGIDAPEASQTCTDDAGLTAPAGRRAAFALSDLIGDKTVTCVARDRDRFDRSVSVCQVADEVISAHMAAAGWSLAFVR